MSTFRLSQLGFCKVADFACTTAATMSTNESGRAFRFEWLPPNNSDLGSFFEGIPDPAACPAVLNSPEPLIVSPCDSQLVHKLLCGHLVCTRTVQACGRNCDNAAPGNVKPPFLCRQCVDTEDNTTWLQHASLFNLAIVCPGFDFAHAYSELVMKNKLRRENRLSLLLNKMRDSNPWVPLPGHGVQLAAKLSPLFVSLDYDRYMDVESPKQYFDSPCENSLNDALDHLHRRFSQLSPDYDS